MSQKFGRMFLAVTVYENRIEVKDGMFPFVRKRIIPAKSISSVSVSKFTKQLEIVTNDGKTYKYALGGFGKAQACRDAIAVIL